MKAIILNASAWMIVPVMDAFAKFLSNSMSVFQIAWARYFFSALFTLSLMLFFYRKTLVWSKNPKLQLIRGFILALSTLCFFLCNFSYLTTKSLNFSICCSNYLHSLFTYISQ